MSHMVKHQEHTTNWYTDTYRNGGFLFMNISIAFSSSTFTVTSSQQSPFSMAAAFSSDGHSSSSVSEFASFDVGPRKSELKVGWTFYQLKQLTWHIYIILSINNGGNDSENIQGGNSIMALWISIYYMMCKGPTSLEVGNMKAGTWTHKGALY